MLPKRDRLRACSVPIVAVLGNHDYESDHVDEVRQALKSANVCLLDGQSCEIGGVSFIGVKGFMGGFGRRMLASFGELAVKSLVAESIMRRSPRRSRARRRARARPSRPL